MRRRDPKGWVFARHKGRYYPCETAAQRKAVPPGATYFIGYFAHGKRKREAIGPKVAKAQRALRQRLHELDTGTWHDPGALTFEALVDLVKSDYRANGRRSWRRVETSVNRLRPVFGDADAADITAAQLARYANDRLDAGAQPSTVRNELNVLKRGMNLAKRTGQLATVPAFPKLTPTNVRTGFFERHELDALLAELPTYVRPVALFMYWTGWRRGEVVSRTWRHVDPKAGVIRLDPGETKNGKGRDFPYALLPELVAVLDAQRAHTDAVERRTGQIVPAVFHREGAPITCFRTAWRGACKRTGLARIPHDFRRTAVRNLVRAGVSEKVAMELTGHLTRSVFERYNITTDRDRRDAVAKLAAAAPDPQILSLHAPYRPPASASA